MTPSFKNQGRIIAFSIIGALIIIGTAWFSKGSQDTWLYVFSIWLILFSAFEVYGSAATHKVSKLALTLLIGAFIILMVTWWANGAGRPWLFLTCVTTLLAAFFILLPQKKGEGPD